MVRVITVILFCVGCQTAQPNYTAAELNEWADDLVGMRVNDACAAAASKGYGDWKDHYVSVVSGSSHTAGWQIAGPEKGSCDLEKTGSLKVRRGLVNHVWELTLQIEVKTDIVVGVRGNVRSYGP